MRAPLSIVIPTLNAQAHLAPCLACLFEGLEAGLIREVVITDGGSDDDTQSIADGVGAVWVSGPAGRGGQLQRGAAQARGDWILFLHADSQLAPGWTKAVEKAMGAGAPGYFWLRFRAKGVMPMVTAGWANLRSRVFGLPYGDQGLLISRADYLAAGGFPDIPLMEDVTFVRRLAGLRPIGTQISTSAERYTAQGWVRRGSRNLFTLARFFMGASPEALKRSYERR